MAGRCAQPLDTECLDLRCPVSVKLDSHQLQSTSDSPYMTERLTMAFSQILRGLLLVLTLLGKLSVLAHNPFSYLLRTPLTSIVMPLASLQGCEFRSLPSSAALELSLSCTESWLRATLPPCCLSGPWRDHSLPTVICFSLPAGVLRPESAHPVFICVLFLGAQSCWKTLLRTKFGENLSGKARLG